MTIQTKLNPGDEDTDRIKRLLEVGMLTGGERDELENYILRGPRSDTWFMKSDDDEIDEELAIICRINSILQNHIGVA